MVTPLRRTRPHHDARTDTSTSPRPGASVGVSSTSPPAVAFTPTRVDPPEPPQRCCRHTSPHVTATTSASSSHSQTDPKLVAKFTTTAAPTSRSTSTTAANALACDTGPPFTGYGQPPQSGTATSYLSTP